MTAVSNGLLLWAVDPEPTHGEIIFDFVSGSVALAMQLQLATVTGTLAVTGANAALAAAGTYTDATPPTPDATPTMPFPRTGGTGRNVRIRLTANLGRLTAHTGLRVEFADEELTEIL